ncbi:hypothetical protein F2P79_006246 [Pimephales promelas]|nr:hypothetical protein F2P79_006246 [Pimephales promelas]
MTQHLGLFWKLLTQRSPIRALLSSHTESTSTGGEVQAGASLSNGQFCSTNSSTGILSASLKNLLIRKAY